MKNILNKEQITAYGFAEFLQLSQEFIKKGYEFNFESNEDYPASFGTFFSANMVQYEVQETKTKKVKVEKVQEIKPEAEPVVPVTLNLPLETPETPLEASVAST